MRPNRRRELDLVERVGIPSRIPVYGVRPVVGWRGRDHELLRSGLATKRKSRSTKW